MSTRAHVEVSDGFPGGVVLYHHSDGYPEFMVPKLVRHLEHAHGLVTRPPRFWWDSERVAALMIAWDVGAFDRPDGDPDGYFVGSMGHNGPPVEDERNGTGWGVPRFHPTAGFHGDISYYYQMQLHRPSDYLGDPERCTYSIEVARPGGGWWDDPDPERLVFAPVDVAKHLAELDDPPEAPHFLDLRKREAAGAAANAVEEVDG